MSEPTTDPAATSGASRRIISARECDHNHECVGCGVHFSEPCHPACPFATGVYRPAVLLRAAARLLREHRGGVGYDVGGALFTAALDLVGEADASGACDEARRILTGYLLDRWGAKAAPIRTELVYRLGLFSDLAEIAMSLYAAAAQHDGIDFDPDTFGDFSA